MVKVRIGLEQRLWGFSFLDKLQLICCILGTDITDIVSSDLSELPQKLRGAELLNISIL